MQPVGEQLGQSRLPDRLGRTVYVVGDAVVGRLPVIGVELEPGGPRVAVAGLAHAAGIEQPAMLGEVQLLAVLGLAATVGAGRSLTVGEPERHVGMPDEAHPGGLLLDALP